MAIKTIEFQCASNNDIELTNDILTKIGKGNRVINAILMLTAQSVRSETERYAVKVSYNGGEGQIIDCVKPTANNTFTVNITEEIICKLNNETDNIHILFDSGLEIKNAVSLAVEYVSEHLMSDDVASCDIDAQRAGSGKVNLATGKLRFNHDLGAGLSLIYNDGQASETATKIVNDNGTETSFKHHFGKGWKLNIEQYLVKTVNADNKEIYTYVDGQGNYHEFSEKYYYVDNKQRHYINKEQVETNLNGKLTYSLSKKVPIQSGIGPIKVLPIPTTTVIEIKDVQIELKSTTGFVLDVNYSKFNGGKYLELRQQEQIELEENIEAYINQFKEYTIVDKADGKCVESDSLESYFDGSMLTTKQYESFMRKVNSTDQTKLLLTESEAINYNSLLLQQTSKINEIGKIVDLSKVSIFGETEVSLVDLQNTLRCRREQLTKFTKKENAAKEGEPKNYQYTKYLEYLNDIKPKITPDLSSLNPQFSREKQFECYLDRLESVGNHPNQVIEPKLLLSEDPYKVVVPLYHLKNDLCDLQAEIERLNDDMACFDRSQTKAYTKDGDNTTVESEDLIRQLKATKCRKDNLEKLLRLFQKQFGNEVEEIQLEITELEKIVNDYLFDEQSQLVNRQINMLFERSEVNKTELDKYFKQYLNKQHELDILYLQLPTHFITSGDGITMGFNKYGQFVAMFDAYENQTAIIYEDGKIVRIQDSDEKVVTFEYENNLLTKIVFADDTSVSFEYVDGMLNAIVDSEEKTSFDYNEESYLIRASHSYGRGVQFVRDGYKRIKSVDETTTLDSVSDDDAEYTEEESKALATFNYHESHMTTTVTDSRDVSKTYIMDIMGKPITVYEGKYYDPDKTTKSLSLEYVDGQKSFSISEDISLPNILTGELEDQKLEETVDFVRQRVFDIDVSKLDHSNYVFSVWAKADSAYIPSVRNSLYCNHDFEKEFGVDVDAIKQNRKFELRAEYTYSDGTTESVCATYDWLNTGWQFVALPIEIKKENGNTLPTEFPFGFDENSKALVGLKLIIDYSNNTGEFFYDCCSLRQGNWKKTDYYEDGKQKSTQDSSSKSKTEYFYDKKGKLVSEELTDYKGRTYTTKYVYNKQGSLVRTTAFDGTVKETVFDEKGREVKKITYNLDDPTSKFYEESKRNEKGVVTADVDESGEYDAVTYSYDHNGEATVQTDGKGNKTAYGYKGGSLVSISGSSDGEESTNTMNYTVGLLTKISCGNTDYNYSYDKWGRNTEVKIADSKYATISYKEESDKNNPTEKRYCTTTVLASGDKFVSETDKYGDTVMQSAIYNNGAQENVVNENDPETRRLNKTTVDINGVEAYNIEYKYDEVDGKLLSSTRNGDHALVKINGYTADGDLQETVYKVVKDTTATTDEGKYETLTYQYETDHNPDKRNSKVSLPFDVEQKFAYDGLGRTKEISLGENLVKDIYYVKYGDHATNRINSVWYGVNGIRKDNTRYTYDKAGNIETVTQNGKLVARYRYDGLNRLVREDNVHFGTNIYQYDNAGNILSKTTYAYTLGDKLGLAQDEKEYSYNQHGWKDQLISFNGEKCGYDVIGNPVVYRNRTLSWQGRRLLRYGNDEYYAEYTYDVGGIRTSKYAITPAGTIDTKYIYDGNNLVAEQRNGTWIYYIYGVDGVAGFNYDGKTYLYRKNVQGDVTHIYKQEEDSSLTLVAQYLYDAWGNHDVLDASDEIDDDVNSIGNINPFRYRSYYFDIETGLYYLQTRYYDPELGRFISADSLEYLDPETLGGLNLYAYCGNNPVMNFDPTGEFFLTCLLIGLIAGAIIGATVGGVVAYNNAVESGATGWDLVGQTLLGVFAGAVIGGVIGAAIGAGIGIGAEIFAAGAAWFGAGMAGTGMVLANGMVIGAGAVALAGVGTMVVGGSIAIGTIALGSYVLSKIPYHGEPNSTIQQGGSTGYYDENGNLIRRRDTTGKPHFIKELNDYFLPHTHEYKWKIIDGIWRIIEKIVHPF